MIRVESIWLACGVSDLRAGMDTLLARVVRGFEGGAQMNTAYVFANRGATRLEGVGGGLSGPVVMHEAPGQPGPFRVA